MQFAQIPHNAPAQSGISRQAPCKITSLGRAFGRGRIIPWHASAGFKRPMPRLATGAGRSRSPPNSIPPYQLNPPSLPGSRRPGCSEERVNTGMHSRMLETQGGRVHPARHHSSNTLARSRGEPPARSFGNLAAASLRRGVCRLAVPHQVGRQLEDLMRDEIDHSLRSLVSRQADGNLAPPWGNQQAFSSSL